MGDSVSQLNFSKGGENMAEGGEAPEGGGGKKKLILIILIVVILIIAGAGAAYLFWPSAGDAESGKTPAPPTGEPQAVAPPLEEGQFYENENPVFSVPYTFTVNLADGKRFLRVTLIIGLASDEALAFLMKREPMVKDFILSTLQSKGSLELRETRGVENLKNSIALKLNRIFTEKFIIESELQDRQPVKKVLFSEFILQ